MKTYFSKEIQMVNKHVNIGWIPLVITEIQIRTNMKCHFTPIKIVIIKNDKCRRGYGEIRTLVNCWWEWKWCSCSRKDHGRTGTWKDAQHQSASGKCKLKPQWDSNSHLAECLLSKIQCEVKRTLTHCWWECELV